MPLNKRDQTALIIGGIGLLLFLCVQFGVYPLYEKKQRLERVLITKQKNLVQMKEMQAQLAQLSSLGNDLILKLEKRNKNFSLFSFLEERAGKIGIKNKIAYMKPSDSVNGESYRQVLVEMKLQAINLNQLVSFLKEIEQPQKLVALQRISIQENKRNRATLDVIMQVVSVAKLDEGLGNTSALERELNNWCILHQEAATTASQYYLTVITT